MVTLGWWVGGDASWLPLSIVAKVGLDNEMGGWGMVDLGLKMA